MVKINIGLVDVKRTQKKKKKFQKLRKYAIQGTHTTCSKTVRSKVNTRFDSFVASRWEAIERKNRVDLISCDKSQTSRLHYSSVDIVNTVEVAVSEEAC